MHKDPLRVLTLGSFWVLQCNSRQKPFVAFGKPDNIVRHMVDTFQNGFDVFKTLPRRCLLVLQLKAWST
jgi:hypothetical protein